MRRLLVPLALLLLTLALPTPARAQEPVVALTLVSQTPWASPDARELQIRFRAENLSDAPIEELSIGVTLSGRLLSRGAFEASLLADPELALDAETLARDGAIAPGEVREFDVTFAMDSPGISPDESGVYPLKVDLRSGFTSLAAIRSSVVFLVREPEEPVALSWTFVLHHPIEFGPDGVFASAELETSLAPGGRLAGQLRALRTLAEDPTRPAVDVALSPVLLSQLGQMRDGYEVREAETVRTVEPGRDGAALAADALEQLRAVAAAPNVRVSALPFSMAEIPSLVAGGLSRDVAVQLDRGADVVTGFLDAAPVPAVLRPPGAALDQPSLRELATLGITTLLAGPATVTPEPHPLGFAGPPTAALGDDGVLRAIVPEPAVVALLDAPAVPQDGVLTAQTVLGMLASIWQEQPGEVRGVALVLSEDFTLPPSFFAAFARSIAGAPWLRPMHAGEFATAFPQEEPSELTAPAPRSFGDTYVAELKEARRRVATYRSMLVTPSDQPDRFDRMLLLAESRQFLSNPTQGLAFITAVRDTVGATFDAIDVDTVDVVTLTSSSGSGVPVTITNGAEEDLRFTVRLVSGRLRGTPTLEVELAAGEAETLTFPVELRSTGRFEVGLEVVAPGGRIIDRQTFVLRSTVYNRIALVITVAAALLLVGMWARRLLQRRTS